MTEILLALLIAVVGLTAWQIVGLRSDLSEWRHVWGQNPAHASDYHAKEILKTTQEIAHYAAMFHMDRQAADPSRGEDEY